MFTIKLLFPPPPFCFPLTIASVVNAVSSCHQSKSLNYSRRVFTFQMNQTLAQFWSRLRPALQSVYNFGLVVLKPRSGACLVSLLSLFLPNWRPSFDYRCCVCVIFVFRNNNTSRTSLSEVQDWHITEWGGVTQAQNKAQKLLWVFRFCVFEPALHSLPHSRIFLHPLSLADFYFGIVFWCQWSCHMNNEWQTKTETPRKWWEPEQKDDESGSVTEHSLKCMSLLDDTRKRWCERDEVVPGGEGRGLLLHLKLQPGSSHSVTMSFPFTPPLLSVIYAYIQTSLFRLPVWMVYLTEQKFNRSSPLWKQTDKLPLPLLPLFLFCFPFPQKNLSIFLVL